VATALLQLDEDTQRAAAEALSLVPGDGHALLFEAAGVEDLLVRRAAIYGLEKVGTPEAAAAIRKLQLEDEQWVVRNAAQQVAAKLDHGAPSIPEPIPPLHEISWLIAFAGRSGEGITAGQSAREMLLRALRDGDDEEKQAAMDLCLRFSIAEAAPTLENYIRHHTQAETRQAAANTLWHLRGAG
jgi:HEAT repeat protein